MRRLNGAPKLTDEDSTPAEQNPRARPGGLRAAIAVLWAFLGVRGQRGYELDLTTLKPVQIVVAGIAGGIIFVLTLLLVVRVILSQTN